MGKIDISASHRNWLLSWALQVFNHASIVLWIHKSDYTKNDWQLNHAQLGADHYFCIEGELRCVRHYMLVLRHSALDELRDMFFILAILKTMIQSILISSQGIQ